MSIFTLKNYKGRKAGYFLIIFTTISFSLLTTSKTYSYSLNPKTYAKKVYKSTKRSAKGLAKGTIQAGRKADKFAKSTAKRSAQFSTNPASAVKHGRKSIDKTLRHAANTGSSLFKGAKTVAKHGYKAGNRVIASTPYPPLIPRSIQPRSIHKNLNRAKNTIKRRLTPRRIKVRRNQKHVDHRTRYTDHRVSVAPRAVPKRK